MERTATLLHQGVNWSRQVTGWLGFLAPFADLLVRLWVAQVFWQAGVSKITSVQSTVLLFQYEYAVPLLPPELAAYLAMFIELVFSVLLALGLAGRFAAFVLFAFNIMAVVSYPGLSPAGLNDHQTWGIMLLVPLLHGPGRLSLDYLIARLFIRPRY